MYRLGIDIGTSAVRLALLKDGKLWKTWGKPHHGRLLKTLSEGLQEIGFGGGAAASPGVFGEHGEEEVLMAVTGGNARILTELCPELTALEEIPATVEGVRHLVPEAGSVIDIGGQGSRFITRLKDAVPEFRVNEHCAGGTGSFFEDQMSRLGLSIEDYSETVRKAAFVPRLSGRCAVFAKTDIIHRQQEGVSIPDILLGLCYAMIRNYKAVIVKNLLVEKPVAFTGGVTLNEGAVRAVREVFGLSEEELIVPEQALYVTALGAALKAEKAISSGCLEEAVRVPYRKEEDSGFAAGVRPRRLELAPGTVLEDPYASGTVPPEGCFLGIDIGSTSTDLVLISEDGGIIDYQYLRTAGDPESAVRKGLCSIRNRFGEISFRSVGVTGSGRGRIGRLIGADAVRDEITAQAKAASFFVPEADTVFEIGGQDSKYISLKNGEVSDFQMNKICAAGTGSFVEEQAARMAVPLKEFGAFALRSEHPAELGERCTVFIQTAIDSAEAEGVPADDIAAGLCSSIVKNYLHKVVGAKTVGQHIVLQGGIAYNPGIVAAFQAVYGSRITVSPCFSVSGAFGAAMLAMEAEKSEKDSGTGRTGSSFKGFDFDGTDTASGERSAEVMRNIAFYRKTREFFLRGYERTRDPEKKTVGIPWALMMHKFFPLANAFFRELGFNVLLSGASDEETIRLSQNVSQGETCFPVKLICGHMQQLIDEKADYIFMPNVHTVRHEKSKVAANYGCVYMQSAASSIGRMMKLEEKGITLLAPVFDLDFGKEALASAMVSTGMQLGFPKETCVQALQAGAKAMRAYDAAAEKLGTELLQSLKPNEKVLVMITRNYGISDPVLNMGIPELLMERGYKVINLEHLPGHDLDLSPDYPNLYWPFGQHILTGAKMISHHPNLYAVYLTNHGCGPDTMLSYMFREEMGEKPYLQIEVDEHFSKVGVVTRVEAFLNALSHRKTEALPEDFDLKAVRFGSGKYAAEDPFEDGVVYVPDFGCATPYLIRYLQTAYGADARALPKADRAAVLEGRKETTAKEYLPYTALLGEVLLKLRELKEPEKTKNTLRFLIPSTQGAEADGQYSRAVRAVLDRKGFQGIGIAAPLLEELPLTARNPELLFRALLQGDLLYLLPPKEREAFLKNAEGRREVPVPDERELLHLAEAAGKKKRSGRRIGLVGTPMCLTSLDENVLLKLERGEHLLRAPLSEYLLFLWEENAAVRDRKGEFLTRQRALLKKIAELAGENGSFSKNPEGLHESADRILKMVSGGNVRYRAAKTAEFGKKIGCRAVLSAAPRYENASMVLEMRNIRDFSGVPYFDLAFDGDWDESAESRLRSFLYYC